MNLTYNINDRPAPGQAILFALQQLLAILAATIAVPVIVGNGMSQTAALFGAGVGTLVYLIFTKFQSPVFLGSSFAFLGSMSTAFAGAVSVQAGYLGLLLGAALAGLVYVLLAAVVRFVGTDWINHLMPPVVIGPTVSIIGLSLAGNAVSDLTTNGGDTTNPYVSIICGLVTLGVTVMCSAFGKKLTKMIPFILGILAGYAVAALFTLLGAVLDLPSLTVIDFSKLQNFSWVPDFTFLPAVSGLKDLTPSYVATIAVAYMPVAFVVFAEHIADHKNLSTIIDHDLLKTPGLHRTLLGDGVGSMIGAIFGGCPNTTYGESVGCVAISGNASIITIVYTAVLAMLISFFAPFAAFLSSIPSCVMGGVCFALYGFIAVSGLNMLQGVDLHDNRNLFVVSVILIAGVGGMTVRFGAFTITEVACALILGIVTNIYLSAGKAEEDREKKQNEQN